MASASVELVKRIEISFLSAPSAKRLAKVLALSDCSPTIIREGYRLSYKALPSLKNSGEKIILSVLNISLTSFVYPTGMVDLIIITASGLIERTAAMTLSIDLVLK